MNHPPHTTDSSTAHDHAEREPLGTSYLQEDAGRQSWESWRRIQADFVDDPERAVAEAHDLVGNLTTRIVERFEGQRHALEQRWSDGERVPTEELRVCLQSYRDFFGRLLPSLRAAARDEPHADPTARPADR
jgi:hypothetical protein